MDDGVEKRKSSIRATPQILFQESKTEEVISKIAGRKGPDGTLQRRSQILQLMTAGSARRILPFYAT